MECRGLSDRRGIESVDPAVRRVPSGPRRIWRRRPCDSLRRARTGIQQLPRAIDGAGTCAAIGAGRARRCAPFLRHGIAAGSRDGWIDRDDPLFGWPAARPPCVSSERQGRRRPWACFCFRCWRMVMPVPCGGVSSAVYRAPGLSTDCVDQHHQRNYRDGSNGGTDTALAAGLNVSWLSGAGLCDEPACSVCAFALGYRRMAGASRVSSTVRSAISSIWELGNWRHRVAA